MSTLPTTNGRNANGQFVRGNRGGPGNPQSDKELAITIAMLVRATPDQIVQAVLTGKTLEVSRDVLLTFYSFPAEHWKHLRTTNPIESTFATVRLRTNKTKGCGSRIACLTMVFKLTQCAQKRWLSLNGASRFTDVIDGVTFVDGVVQSHAA